MYVTYKWHSATHREDFIRLFWHDLQVSRWNSVRFVEDDFGDPELILTAEGL